MPFGYSAKDKKLVVNEAEAQIVREAFTLFLAHRQMGVVARELNKRGLLPRGLEGATAARGGTRTASRASSEPDLRGLHDVRRRVARRRAPPAHRRRHVPPPAAPRGHGRVVRVTGTNPDYVLRGPPALRLAAARRCARGRRRRAGKTPGFYRCSRRENAAGPVRRKPLPAAALSRFVVARISGRPPTARSPSASRPDRARRGARDVRRGAQGAGGADRRCLGRNVEADR